MTTNITKTLVTPEMADDIRKAFLWHIDFWTEEFFQSKGYDETALSNLGLSAFDLDNAGLSARSAETEAMESRRETLEFLLGVFERGTASEEFYLEDELEFYALHIRHRRETAPEYPGIIGGYETAQEILQAYLA